ncbi:MAG: response regulator transcription factor [Gallionella sp.]|nr:response regulator transcription factor [Gallionella sp.]
MTIRLAITDDHELIRAGLIQYLGMSPDIKVVAEASNGAELLEKLRTTPIDLLLLDMSMPGISGEDLIARIKSAYPDVRILVLSMHNETQVVLLAMKAGASGYICKSCSPQILLEAIRKVAAMGRYLEPAMAERLAYTAASPTQEPIRSILSERELQVLRLIVEGKSISEIASQLFISDKTASTHKCNIQSKLGLKSVAELVRYAIDHKLLDSFPRLAALTGMATNLNNFAESVKFS